MEVRNEEMTPFGELSCQEQRLLEERYTHGEVEYFNDRLEKWYHKNDSVWYSSMVYRTKPKEDEQQMKETQPCNGNSFPWHMVDSKWNAVARDGNYPVWYLHEERPDINKSTQTWDSQDCACFSKDAQKVVGTDMSQWKDIPWEESLMLRPGYQEKTEKGNCDDVFSKEEADHLVNSVKEYPVVKMKELRNYAIGDVVRLKKTGELVEIDKFNWVIDCYRCALREVTECGNKTKCDNFPSRVYFREVME